MPESTAATSGGYRVLALYHFARLVPLPSSSATPGTASTADALRSIRDEVESTLRSNRARGTILLAPEGINGTICYPLPSSAAKSDLSSGKQHHRQRNHRLGPDGAENGSGGDEEATHETTTEDNEVIVVGVDERRKEGISSDGRENDVDDDGDAVVAYLRSHPLFGGPGLRLRPSRCEEQAFVRLKVKVKREIVTMGIGTSHAPSLDGIGGDVNDDGTIAPVDEDGDGDNSHSDDNDDAVDPTSVVGTYVPPGPRWNDLIDDPAVAVIDVRNRYEVDLGTFESAIDPGTESFREFPAWLRRFAEGGESAATSCDNGSINEHNGANLVDAVGDGDGNGRRRRPKAIAMFCTGGIRCEKATSYVLSRHLFPRDVPVYHLEGGILAYLASVPPDDSKWRGECFVFDRRVAVSHGLRPSRSYTPCHGCRRPLSGSDRADPLYVPGVRCRYCSSSKEEEGKDDATAAERHRKRVTERQRQVELADKVGLVHLHDPKEEIVAASHEEMIGDAVARH